MSSYHIEELIVEQNNEIERMRDFIRGEAQTQEIHRIEECLFKQLLQLGLSLLKEAVARKGVGKVDDLPVDQGGEKIPLHSIKRRRYVSIFGELTIDRCYYWSPGLSGIYPLDSELNLPEGFHSHLLNKWIQQRVAEGPYDESISSICELLNSSISKRTVEELSVKAANYIGSFNSSGSALEEEEGSVLIATADCKGVAMVPSERPEKAKPDQEASGMRRGKGGRKKGLRRDAVVTSDFSIDSVARSPQDIIDALMTVNAEKKGKNETDELEHRAGKERLPKNKKVAACMYGKKVAFKDLADRLKRRDPKAKKPIYLLFDGERALEKGVRQEFKEREWEIRIKGVCLDIIHVSEYVWEVGTALHGERNPKRADWVRRQLLALLEGRVGRVIGGFRQTLTKRNDSLRKSHRQTLEKAINYFENHKHMMNYKHFLNEGLPIATGVIEGACGSLVKDRTDCSGMKWTRKGSQAVLDLRSLKRNGDWEDYWEYYLQEEHDRLYGEKAA